MFRKARQSGDHDPLTVEVTRTGDKEQHIRGLSPVVWDSTVTPKPPSLLSLPDLRVPDENPQRVKTTSRKLASL
jgi:hypothetical protein